MLHIHNEIFHNLRVRERFDTDRFFEIAQLCFTTESLLSVNVHRVRATDCLPTGMPEGERRVVLVA